MPFQDESETVETSHGQFVNQMKSGRLMIPRFEGEKSIYPTAEEADQAAGMRSKYEYDELRRDPNNEWYTPGTPAPPLLDVPGMSMHQPPPIGKKQSMVDPLTALKTVQLGAQALQTGKMSEHGFDYDAHQQQMLQSGPFADANRRQSAWDESYAHPLMTPTPSEPAPVLTAGMPVGIGGEGNKSASEQLKALDAENNVTPDATQKAQMKSLKPIDATQGVLEQSIGTPSAYGKAPVPIESADAQNARLKAKQDANAAIDRKLGLGGKAKSFDEETPAERAARYKKLGL